MLDPGVVEYCYFKVRVLVFRFEGTIRLHLGL